MGAGKFSARSGDRRDVEAELIARLHSLPVNQLPDARFTAELRAQLVAITPRIVAESAPVSSRKPSGPPRGGRWVLVHRPLIAFAGAASVLVLLLGMAVWMSGGALPGQSLYGIKRASENFQLSVAGSDTAKGLKYLKFAASRAQESGELAGSGQVSTHTDALVASTLRAADSDTRNGMRLLGNASIAQMSAAPIASVGGWVSQQRGRIAALATHLPPGPGRSQAVSSLALLQRVALRASKLKAEIGCGCLSQANSDELGPLPCSTCVPHRPNLPGQTGTGQPGTGQPGGTSSGLPSLPTGLPSGSPTSGVPLPNLPGLGGGTGQPLPSGLPGLPSGGVPVPSSPAASNGGTVTLPGIGISGGTGGIVISVTPSLP